jgi:hypothetical protein
MLFFCQNTVYHRLESPIPSFGISNKKMHRPWVGSNHQPSGFFHTNTASITAERASQLRHRGSVKQAEKIALNKPKNLLIIF